MTNRAVRVPSTQGEFGRLLRTKRIARKNNRVHIGHRVSISPRFYGIIGNGNKFPSLPVFARLWRVMEFDANEVLAAVQGAIRDPTGDDAAITIPVGEVTGHYIAFGRLLARARMNAQLSRSSLAHAIDVTPRQVACDECGHTVPTVSRLARLHRLLGFDAGGMLATLADPASASPFDKFGDYIQMARIKRAMRPGEAIQKLGCDPVRYERIELGLELPSFVLAVHMYRILRFDITQALLSLWHTDALNKLDVAQPYNPDSTDDGAVAHLALGETR